MSKFSLFFGAGTALCTPFEQNGELDLESYRKLLRFQLDEGIDALLVCGTTGETPTLTTDERKALIRFVRDRVAGRVALMVGIGGNCTHNVVASLKSWDLSGYSAVLSVNPYYNKPNQEGLYQHFKAIAEATDLPIMLYSIPGRSGIEIAVDTVARLAVDCPTIVAIKEAGGSVERVNQLVQALPADFAVLSGDDGLTVPFISCGAVGLVSVTSNVAPAEMKALVDAAMSGDGKKALELQKKYYPLMKGLMSLDVNPVPAKAALALRGQIGWEIRLPLVPLAEEKHGKLADLLKSFNLL